MKHLFRKIKDVRIFVLAAVLCLLPLGWNACGKKQYSVSTFNSQDIVDLSDCMDTAPDVTQCVKDNFAGQSKNISVKENKDVDILFVVDNSGSMEQEQKDIGKKINGFLSKIKDLNWRIALTTTDAGANTKDHDKIARPWGDGQFRPFDSLTGSEYMLRSDTHSASAAQTKLSYAIDVGIHGSGTERGINASYRAIERSSAASSPNGKFFRQDARLAIVIISDEDECSKGVSECSAQAKSHPENLISFIQSRYGSSKVFNVNSIILDETCTTGGNIGHTYRKLSQLTGGQIGPVCASDYTALLGKIGDKVVDLVKSITLSCAARDVNGDGKPDVRVLDSFGNVLSSGFTVSGSTVTFPTALPAGNYSVKYFCLQ